MKKLLCLLLALTMTLALAACGEKTPTGGTGADAGGTRSELRMMYGSEVETFNYLSTGNTNDLEMSANVVDCLVEYDTYGVIQPALAERWEPNEDNTVWTFYIRPGVKWVDAGGNVVADVTAHDWVTTAAYVLDAANNCANQYMYDGIVKNAADYFEQTAAIYEAETAVQGGDAASVEEYYAENEIDPSGFTLTMDDVGVKAEDDLTLVYTMEEPCPFFPSVLSYSTYMPVYGPFLAEQGGNFGMDNETILYNGAFVMTEFEPQNHRTLVKNPAYWDPDNVHIERMEWLYNSSIATLAPEFFSQGEIDYALMNGDVLDAWLNDPAKADMVSAARVTVDYSYFYAFNFEPRYDAEYEPENWMIAVNNENFRHAIYAGLNRINALTVYEPYNPAGSLNNTVTPANFAIGGGKDYTQYAPLLPYTDSDSFNEAAALNYRDLAKDELTAAGATFPIKILMPYNPATSNWDKECQVVEQQLETLLGSDFIDIIVQAGPSTGFLGAVRRTGAFALMKCNWGADYADPQTWTDPFSGTNSYNFMYTDAGKVLSDIPATNKTDGTQSIVARYYELIAEAKAITTDEAARYEAFATAEAFLLGHAIVIPFSVSNEGYRATRLNVFEGQYAPYGLARQRYKFQYVYETPVSMDQFNERLAVWETERAAAIAK